MIWQSSFLLLLYEYEVILRACGELGSLGDQLTQHGKHQYL